MTSLADQVIEKIQYTKGLYFRLLLVVAPASGGKTAALRAVHERTGAPLLNVNLEVTRRMLELTERQRSLQLPRLLSELVNEAPADLVLLDNIEVLFDITLKQDPLRLLQGLSRNKTVVASWNGSVEKERLRYAVPDHPEYRRYPLRDFIVVNPEVIP